MGKLFSNLVQEGSSLEYPSGRRVYGDPQDILKTANDSLARNIPMPDVAGPSEMLDASLEGRLPAAPPSLNAAALPKISTPSYGEVVTDSAGNFGPSPAASKKGKLLGLLFGMAQGGVDAAAGGALDAVPGRSNFGAGIAAAQGMRDWRTQRAEQARRQALEDQWTQARIDAIPAQQAQAQAELEATRAHTGLFRAQTAEAQRPPKSRLLSFGRESGIAEVTPEGAVNVLRQPAAAPEKQKSVEQILLYGDPGTEEYRRAKDIFTKQHPGRPAPANPEGGLTATEKRALDADPEYIAAKTLLSHVIGERVRVADVDPDTAAALDKQAIDAVSRMNARRAVLLPGKASSGALPPGWSKPGH